MALRRLIGKLESELTIAQLHVDDEVKTYYSNVRVIALLRCHAKFKRIHSLDLSLGNHLAYPTFYRIHPLPRNL